MKVINHIVELTTGAESEAHDLTPSLRELLATSGLRHGYVLVSSRHTTCAVTINENEPRLIEDMKSFLARLAPRQAGYRHDDIALRDCPPDEPENAHSHMAAMLLGNAQVVPVSDGDLALGRWQSVMLFELDGPRARTVAVQICGVP